MPVGEDAEFLDRRSFARHLRNNPTPAERAIWDGLKAGKTPYKFRRQVWIDENTCVDFCCPSVRVIVELDGESHQGKEDWDKARDARLGSYGFVVLRFPNQQALQHPAEVVRAIVAACEGRNRRRY